MGFSMLTGEVGTGKTLLTRAVLARLDKTVETALLVNPLLSVPELLKAITKDFGIPVRFNSPQKQIEALNRFLLGIASEGRNALVIIDEAQNLSVEALEMVRMLTNLETETMKLLQILLVGQPELLRKLRSHELRQLDQRITTRYNLTPLSQVDMMRYINHRICIAGGGGKVFFDPSAYKLIYKETEGYPRLINILCDKAMMAAYVKEIFIITKAEVQAAICDWKGEDRASPFGFFKEARVFLAKYLLGGGDVSHS
jgi:general secretion pathway protein A